MAKRKKKPLVWSKVIDDMGTHEVYRGTGKSQRVVGYYTKAAADRLEGIQIWKPWRARKISRRAELQDAFSHKVLLATTTFKDDQPVFDLSKLTPGQSMSVRVVVMDNGGEQKPKTIKPTPMRGKGRRKA